MSLSLLSAFPKKIKAMYMYEKVTEQWDADSIRIEN